MTDLLKKLHAELGALFSQEDETPVVTKNRKAKDIEEDDDEVETPVKAKGKPTKPAEDEDEDEVEADDEDEAPKPKKGKATMVQVKAKLKEVLEAKGRDAAVALLKSFDGAEKVGELEEESYGEFLFQTERVLSKKAKDSNIKKKAKVEDDDDDL